MESSRIMITGFPKSNHWWIKHVDSLDSILSEYGDCQRTMRTTSPSNPDDPQITIKGEGVPELPSGHEGIGVEIRLNTPMCVTDIKLLISKLDFEVMERNDPPLSYYSFDNPSFNMVEKLERQETATILSQARDKINMRASIKDLTKEMEKLELKEKKAAEQRNYVMADEMKLKLRKMATNVLQIEKDRVSLDISMLRRNEKALRSMNRVESLERVLSKITRRQLRLQRLNNITIPSDPTFPLHPSSSIPLNELIPGLIPGFPTSPLSSVSVSPYPSPPPIEGTPPLQGTPLLGGGSLEGGEGWEDLMEEGLDEIRE
ncbi:hypothetical protein AAMO2058_000964100, partial [Amorphochlora amoebiformis]